MNALRSSSVFAQQRRNYSKGSVLYQNVLKSNFTYLIFIFTGAAVTSGVYNTTGDFVWKQLNRGRLYEQIDWSKWESMYKDEEEE